MSPPASNSAPAPKPRGGSVIAAGLLLLALAVVVLYTSHSAFSSPLALVVLAAIGLAALLLQLRLQKDVAAPVRAPLGLNVLGLIFAVAAIVADLSHFSANFMMVSTLGAVVCFAISGTTIIHSLRKKKS